MTKKMIKENLSFKSPSGIDMDEEKNLLYIADKNTVTILNITQDIISVWNLPSTSGHFRALKFDDNILYITIEHLHQIFLCNPEDGKVIRKWGTESRGAKEDEFDRPYGITLNKKYVYICDSLNHRIQILTKENGRFNKQWGDGLLSSPDSIYYSKSEEIVYIGDSCSVRLYTTNDDKCIQRIGGTFWGSGKNQFDVVFGVFVFDDQLYVSDYGNKRIQIFRKEKN